MRGLEKNRMGRGHTNKQHTDFATGENGTDDTQTNIATYRLNTPTRVIQ